MKRLISSHLAHELAVMFALQSLMACSSDETPVNGDHGPPGAILEVDPSQIGASSGGATHSGGRSASGGSLASGGGDQVAGANSGGAPGAHGGAFTRGGASAGGSPGLTSLGEPCESDADCDAPLRCHLDFQDYVGHKQCTLPCADSATCQAALSDSFCIGARICVRPCSSALDCPTKTECISAAWCQRGGPGSGIEYCSGVALSCAARSPDDCLSGLGCTDQSRCSGLSTSCSVLQSSTRCTLQQGCTWNYTSSRCSGVPSSCSSKTNQVGCGNLEGCSWSESCTGTPTACRSIASNALCELQLGCIWVQ